MYINLKTKEVVTREQLEALFPNVGFPVEAVDEVLEDFGYANVRSTPAPKIEPGQSVAPGPVDKDDDGYFFTWVVSDRVIDSYEIDLERDRRVELGFEYDGNLYQSRQTDRENITGASQLAMMAIINGAKKGDYRWADSENDFQWITSDNEIVKLDAYETFALGKAAAETKQKLIFAARTLKDMSPIPSNYSDDKWWTA